MIRQLFYMSLVTWMTAVPSLTQSVAGQAASSAPGAQPQTTVAQATAITSSPLGDAKSLYRKGKFDECIAKYQEILRANPKSPDAFAGEVRAYLKQKKIEVAAQTADQGVAATNSPRVRVARAEVWFRQGRIAEAEKEWVEVVNSGYPEPRAYLGLARQRYAIAMYKSAKKMIEKAHELDPSDPDIQEQWIGTLSRPERIKYLEESLAGDNTWDAEQRDDVANYLQYLKERAKQKNSSTCRLVSKVKSTETPLVRLLEDPQHMRGYGLQVSLNGHKSALMLDTGASGILVRRAIAERAGISKISETKVGGIGKKGRRDAYIGIVDSITIGELEFQNCTIEVIEGRSVVGDEGLIGADVFEDFLVELDFPNEKLKLSELPKRPGEAESTPALKEEDEDEVPGGSDAASPPADNHSAQSSPTPSSFNDRFHDRYISPEMHSYTAVFRFGHNLLIPTTIGKVPYKLFLLDTGALVNFISPAAAREVTKVHADSDVVVEGISGRVDKVYSANKAVLQFGRLRQENQDITAFDTTSLSDNIGTEVSGFLGFVTLRMLDIKIDYRDALVSFEFDAKRFGQ